VRNLALALLLANLLVLAWSRWVSPLGEPAGPTGLPALPEFRAPPPSATAAAAPAADPPPGASPPGGAVPPMAAACVRIGPLPAADAAAGLAKTIESKGFSARTVALDGQAWLGHWVQLAGFGSAAEAEVARDRLAGGGLADAYLMQDGGTAIISLGVFRDRGGADRVAAAARRLGFAPVVTERYRPAVEHWVVAVLPPDSVLARDALAAGGSQILRVEAIECPAPAAGTGVVVP
jgi:hypothetical protein